MIGKIVLTILVAAAKINQSSIVPAFDQTRVPRIIQVPSGAANPWPLGHVRQISFLGLVCAALLFFSTCESSHSGPSGPVSKRNTHVKKLRGKITTITSMATHIDGRRR